MEQAVTKVKKESEERLNAMEEFGTRLKKDTREKAEDVVGILKTLPS